MTIKDIISKIKKMYKKPTIERVAIFTPERAILGMSKSTQARHAEFNRQLKCLKECRDRGEL